MSEATKKKGDERMEKVATAKINAYIISDTGSISVIVNGDSHTVAVDHVNYDKILVALKNNDAVNLMRYMDLATEIKRASAGKVIVENGSVYFNGKEIINPLTDRILRFVNENLPFESMVAFLDNLLLNPSRTAIQELFLFMDNNGLPITEDGFLIAYRKVNNEYMSFHANPDGTLNRNMVGDVVEKERNEVDDNRDRTCSEGLHFCSLSYLPMYNGGNGRVMLVKINPKDVVSIPSDYNNAKGRCCKYEVIAEHTDPNKEYTEYTDSAVVTSSGGEVHYDENTDDGIHWDDNGEDLDDGYYDDEQEQELEDEDDWEEQEREVGNISTAPNYHNVRDSHGRFIKRS